MILVTVGTHDQQFDRLVKGADQLSAELGEKVIIQRGCSNYVPKYSDHFQWTSSQQMETLTGEARIVISQASAGAIILALSLGKPMVLVPRLKRYGENHDDHQLQLARALDNQGRAVIVDEPNASILRVALEQSGQQFTPPTGADKLQRALQKQLDEWTGPDIARDQNLV